MIDDGIFLELKAQKVLCLHTINRRGERSEKMVITIT